MQNGSETSQIMSKRFHSNVRVDLSDPDSHPNVRVESLVEKPWISEKNWTRGLAFPHMFLSLSTP